ncbi:hypothetical protein GZH47_31740 (plasmid) [Paenibacillus rhizovicinus]|uniref:Uncharacterized protein n=1 Tax=Paenibacillus rhizovicinus TaxID=2704463 RepID=A0A6C0PA33_9BACL|nr:hypothetical protein [Paenibacillus rhizovicinus]QHW35470.1 hypothetical protein GZH47_31740 [Paenibacillus rhizovicinus]
MFIDAIGMFIFIFLLTLIAIPMSALIVTLRARIGGRYLNRYFIISRKKSGVYEIHHQPMLGFYYAGERKFHRLWKEAIWKFQVEYPDLTLIANTLTFVSRSRGAMPVETSRLMLMFSRYMGDFLIVLNLANYRRVEGKWRVLHLIQKVHRRIPVTYILVGEKP